jgi:cytochrome P450
MTVVTTSSPPGPRGLPGLGVAPEIARDPYGSFQRWAREYGDVATIPVPGMRLVLVSHPDYVKHVTNTRQADYPKPPLFEDIIFRNGPRFHGMANGEEWRRVRKTLNPKFTHKGLTPLSDTIAESIHTSVENWHGRLDMQDELAALTMGVLMSSMFTTRPERSEIDALAANFTALMRGMAVNMLTISIPERVPRPYGRSTERAIADILAYIDRMVAERRRTPIEGEDLLSMVLEAEFDDGTRMSEEQIRRELMGLIIGGYETTAAVMSWVLARLPFAPEAQARAYAEVDALGGRPVTVDDVAELEYLRAVFDEAQRLQGFVLNAREATVDDEIGGYAIPAGTTVAFSGQTLHRDPRWWREPERFLPERFLEDEINKYAFVPFGVGPRRCLGMRMGYMVGLLTLASAFQRYDFTPLAGWTPQPRFVFSSIVKGGVPMTVTPRR